MELPGCVPDKRNKKAPSRPARRGGARPKEDRMLTDNDALGAFCEAAGEPMRASYTVRELSTLTGVDVHGLYKDIGAGRLRTYMPAGNTRGRRVLASEADAWIKECWRSCTPVADGEEK